MEVSKVDEKLSQVLKLFLLADYSVTSTTYLDLLLTHIANSTSKSDDQCKIIKDYIERGCEIWINSKPCQPVIVFTIKLIGVLGKNICYFEYFDKLNIYNKLLDIFNLRKDDLSASIKMAYTTMLLDIIGHDSGRKWVINSGIWKDVVKFAQFNHTMYVTRESHKFIYQLLINESQNIGLSTEIIKAVSEPLINDTYGIQVHSALEDLYLDQTRVLATTLGLITSILENALFSSLDNTIPNLLEQIANLEVRVKALLEACISTKFLQNIHKLWVLLYFYKIKSGFEKNDKNETVVNPEAWSRFRVAYCYLQTLFISKNYITEFVRTNKFSLIYWKKLQALETFHPPELKHKFEHQVVASMVTPLLVCLNKSYKKHDIFEMFVHKMFTLTCQPIQRLAYEARDVMLKEELPLELICKSCIEMLLEVVDLMDRDTAVIAFQSMCHVLKNYVASETCSNQVQDDGNCENVMPQMINKNPNDSSPILLSALLQNSDNYHQVQNSNSDNCCPVKINNKSLDHLRTITRKSILDGDPIVDTPVLLSTLLDGVAVMTEKFQFKWSDCVETICVLALAQEILNHSGTSPHLCVRALKICRLAIENFMPPNLALLVNGESHMNNIGPTLYKRLHDGNWEVRDSALEVLHVIANISEITYPAFQELILTNKLLPLVTDIAMKDGESYVRASALKFIAITVRINNLWNKELSSLDLFDRSVELFCEESEAIVRKEVVILLRELYVYRQWPSTVLDTINHTMVVAAVLDLHWEVKINALSYWHDFIKFNLTEQGMLDGEFPMVTFSKEHKKIVQLTDDEINNRLNKALDNMAKENCLGVLLVTLEDESDFEVSKYAADIINELKRLLLKYKLNQPTPNNNSSYSNSCNSKSNTPCSTKPSASEPETNSTDKDLSRIIDDIIDSNDSSLLATMYKNSLKMNDECEMTKRQALDRISKVTREQFLSHILNSDIDAYIAERRNWLKTYTVSFDSILDDILTVYAQNDTISMDCY
ncbi:uncharacterized protein LOC130663104 [Microplitis mediator]|uniref:uncharacterized protein LOC130663104 n=1 Tax=Microplitis mediator TaxID=375433 RepID=UPI002555C29B|nr:uncharacterized protein LOC130663104 [Microplitis mediator]